VRGNPVRSAARLRSAAASTPGALRHGSVSIAAIAVINMMDVMAHTLHERV